MEVDRARADRPGGDVTASDEREAFVVEIVSVEVVHDHAERPRPHECVEDLVFEEHVDGARHLVRVVSADDALTSGGVVGSADPRQQEETGIVQDVRGDDHEVGWLFDLSAARVDVGHACGSLARGVEVDLHDVAQRP